MQEFLLVFKVVFAYGVGLGILLGLSWILVNHIFNNRNIKINY